jgi:hypothetical protein
VPVKITKTPHAPAEAAQPAATRTNETTVRDARGRTITLKKPTALDRMRLALLVGSDASENAAFMQYANLAASVLTIDGMPAPLTSMIALEGLVGQLDEDGLAAVLQGWLDAGWIKLPPKDGEAAPGLAKDNAAKN